MIPSKESQNINPTAMRRIQIARLVIIAVETAVDIVNITLHFFLKDVRSMLPPAVNHSIAVS